MVGFQRYVALGDSSTEGLVDPDGRGGYRGWADRLAEHVATTSPDLLYANLAVRGMGAGEIRDSQLEAALAMRPDLATVVAGMNDLFRSAWDPRRIAGIVGEMVHGLRDLGTTVILFTIPDPSRRMRLGRTLTPKTEALNVELRALAGDTGALLLDLAAYEIAHDTRYWAGDRIHGNPAGHARIAEHLAHMLGVPTARPDALTAFPAAPPVRRRDVLVEDLAWFVRDVTPWMWRRLRGRTTGHGRTAKRPVLAPVRR